MGLRGDLVVCMERGEDGYSRCEEGEIDDCEGRRGRSVEARKMGEKERVERLKNAKTWSSEEAVSF